MEGEHNTTATPPTATAEAPPEEGPSDGRELTILVAEDDRATRLRILAYLRDWGYDVVEAADGTEAWEKFQQLDPAIVISDWQMPGMDGVELIRRIRGDDQDASYHYTLLLTSRSEMKDLVEGLEAGADDFVAKPFDKDELRVRVQAGERIIKLEHALEEQNEKLEASNRAITKANQRMKESLLSAASIQRSFLPEAEKRVGNAAFATCYEPCEELAGDTLNIIPLDEDHVAAYAIDVSGHGVPAALLSVHLSRILTRTRGPDTILCKPNGDGEWKPTAPAEVLMQLNRRFMFDTANQQYFTMVYGVFDLKRRQFRYSSAGHPGPVLVSRGKTEVLQPMPPAVGFLPKPEFAERTLDLEVGDRLLFYTDGVFEVANDGQEEFGEERLAKTFADGQALSLGQTLESVLAEARAWGGGEPFDDDISLMAAEIT